MRVQATLPLFRQISNLQEAAALQQGSAEVVERALRLQVDELKQSLAALEDRERDASNSVSSLNAKLAAAQVPDRPPLLLPKLRPPPLPPNRDFGHPPRPTLCPCLAGEEQPTASGDGPDARRRGGPVRAGEGREMRCCTWDRDELRPHLNPTVCPSHGRGGAGAGTNACCKCIGRRRSGRRSRPRGSDWVAGRVSQRGH